MSNAKTRNNNVTSHRRNQSFLSIGPVALLRYCISYGRTGAEIGLHLFSTRAQTYFRTNMLHGSVRLLERSAFPSDAFMVTRKNHSHMGGKRQASPKKRENQGTGKKKEKIIWYDKIQYIVPILPPSILSSPSCKPLRVSSSIKMALLISEMPSASFTNLSHVPRGLAVAGPLAYSLLPRRKKTDSVTKLTHSHKIQ